MPKDDGRMGFKFTGTLPAHSPGPTARSRVPLGWLGRGSGLAMPKDDGRMGFIQIF